MSKYYLVDTNVLLAASGLALHLRPRQTAAVSDWLMRFHLDGDAYLLLDSEGAPTLTKSRILEEYLRKMSKTAPGWQAIKAKLDTRRLLCYKIAYEGLAPHEYAALPPTLSGRSLDLSDRKFVAVALAHIKAYPRQRCRIVNATDTDWALCSSILYQHYIDVEQILD